MLKAGISHLGFGIGLVLLLGCGAAEQTDSGPGAPPESSGLTDFDPAVNVCPHFEGSLILPQTVLEGEYAFIAVRATDPDADDLSLTYRWSAPSGEFSSPLEPTTEYRCAVGGVQPLTVVASDLRSCDVELQLDITCIFE